MSSFSEFYYIFFYFVHSPVDLVLLVKKLTDDLNFLQIQQFTVEKEIINKNMYIQFKKYVK